MKASIYHNPKCSKSRATLSLLEERNVEVEEIRYLETPPDFKTLKHLIGLLDCAPEDILRKGEAREAGILDLSGDELIEAMLANPQCIERPIVVHEKRAAIGRPPENVLTLF